MPSPCRQLRATGRITNRSRATAGLFDHSSVLAETRLRAIGPARQLLKIEKHRAGTIVSLRQARNSLELPLRRLPNVPGELGKKSSIAAVSNVSPLILCKIPSGPAVHPRVWRGFPLRLAWPRHCYHFCYRTRRNWPPPDRTSQTAFSALSN
jgi:hypothetical protein